MLSTNIRSHTEFRLFIFYRLWLITCLVNSVFFIRHGWRKWTESCHKILFQSRSVCDRDTGIGTGLIWNLKKRHVHTCGPGSSVGIATDLRAGRSRDRIPVGAKISAPIQTGPAAQPASCTMGTGSFPRLKCGRGVLLITHPLLVPWSWMGRAIPLPTLWATTGPVTGLLYLYLYLSLYTCLPHVSSIFKKINPKILDRTVYRV